MTRTDTTTREEPITKPPTRWKNRWRAPFTHERRCTVCGRRLPIVEGEVFESHCRTYPSRDAAETHARELRTVAVYLGAFPVDDA